jgi:hypothetical protein
MNLKVTHSKRFVPNHFSGLMHPVLAFLLFLGFVIILVSTGCRDAFNECLSGPGKTTTHRMGLYDFGNVRVRNNISLTIENGVKNELQITGGEHIIPMLGIEIIGNTLILSNKSTCPMLKDPWENIEMKLTLSHLDTLFVESYGDIKCQGEFSQDSLVLRISDSPANVDVNFDCSRLHVESLSGTATVKIRGRAKVVNFYHAGYGRADLTKLISDYMYMNMQSSNDSFIRGGEIYFYAVIGTIGNVYYCNDPEIIDLTLQSTGQLIRLQ